MSKRRNKQAGFTLLELLIVIVAVVILVVMATFIWQSV